MKKSEEYADRARSARKQAKINRGLVWLYSVLAAFNLFSAGFGLTDGKQAWWLFLVSFVLVCVATGLTASAASTYRSTAASWDRLALLERLSEAVQQNKRHGL